MDPACVGGDRVLGDDQLVFQHLAVATRSKRTYRPLRGRQARNLVDQFSGLKLEKHAGKGFAQESRLHQNPTVCAESPLSASACVPCFHWSRMTKRSPVRSLSMRAGADQSGLHTLTCVRTPEVSPQSPRRPYNMSPCPAPELSPLICKPETGVGFLDLGPSSRS